MNGYKCAECGEHNCICRANDKHEIERLSEQCAKYASALAVAKNTTEAVNMEAGRRELAVIADRTALAARLEACESVHQQPHFLGSGDRCPCGWDERDRAALARDRAAETGSLGRFTDKTDAHDDREARQATPPAPSPVAPKESHLLDEMHRQINGAVSEFYAAVRALDAGEMVLLKSLLARAYAELNTIEAITVSPRPMDGLMALLNEMADALRAPKPFKECKSFWPSPEKQLHNPPETHANCVCGYEMTIPGVCTHCGRNKWNRRIKGDK
jgi:hypothetical protein